MSFLWIDLGAGAATFQGMVRVGLAEMVAASQKRWKNRNLERLQSQLKKYAMAASCGNI